MTQVASLELLLLRTQANCHLIARKMEDINEDWACSRSTSVGHMQFCIVFFFHSLDGDSLETRAPLNTLFLGPTVTSVVGIL